MVSGGEINVSPVDGGSQSAYQLGDVDTSTYTTDGLSWISDDEGWVKDAASSSGSGRTVVFFIDGVQVPQTVAVARISDITRVDAVTVEVTYTVKSFGADTGHGNVVRFSVDDGKLSVGDTGEMDSALLWNTDIPYEATGQDSSRGNGPQPTTAGSGGGFAAPTEPAGSDDLYAHWNVPFTGTVEPGTFISTTGKGQNSSTELRCLLEKNILCFSKNSPYWELNKKPVSYVDISNLSGNVSDLGAGWSSSAKNMVPGDKFAIVPDGDNPSDKDTYIYWTGHTFFFGNYENPGAAIFLAHGSIGPLDRKPQ